MKKNLILIGGVVGICLGMGGRSVFAANYPHDTTGRQFPAFLYEETKPIPAATKTQLENVNSQDLKFDTRQKGPDNQGSRVGNVRTFTVDVKEHLLPPDKEFVLVYYVDDVPIKQFEKVRLPFKFTRDFRGHRPGACVVKIDIEDDKGNLLATQTTKITVKP